MSKADRPRWRVNEQSFVGHALVGEGTEVYYTPTADGEVSANLSPLNDEAQAIIDKQKKDHPDKAVHAGKKAKIATDEAEELALAAQETDNGPVPPRQVKGDTKTKADKAAAKAAAKAAEAAAAAQAGEAKEDDDIG